MKRKDLLPVLEEGLKRPWEKPVRNWKEKHPGGKVVGCFPVYSPVELIHASGALPVGLFGGGTQVELARADARFVSFVCSIAKTTLELALQGKLDGLDALFFHSICDVARNLSTVMGRNLPHLRVEYLHLPQNPSSPAAVDYYREELRRIAARLGELTGTPVTAARLAASIAAYNECRQAQRALEDLRAAEPDRVPISELCPLLRAATWLPVEESTALLREAEAEFRSRAVVRRDRIRVLVEGAFCEQPPMDFLTAIEEAGCHVVGDDLMKGWRWFRSPLPADGDPFSVLARAYLENSDYSSVRHDWRRRREPALVEKARALRADAVLFAIAKFCEPALFDYVLFKRELDREGIPHLLLEYEEKMWTFERTREEVETFVESILFR